jgi:hypothetical protein
LWARRLAYTVTPGCGGQPLDRAVTRRFPYGIQA